MVLLRHKLLVDSDVQGALLRRVALYGAACTLYFSVILICSESMTNPSDSFTISLSRCFDEMIYWLPGFAILAPVIAYDILRVTNRFTGPIFRLRREMLRLIEGNEVQTLKFREDDYWNEMAEIFNQVRQEVLELREEKANATPSASSGPEIQPQARLFTSDEEDSEEESELLTTSEK